MNRLANCISTLVLIALLIATWGCSKSQTEAPATSATAERARRSKLPRRTQSRHRRRSSEAGHILPMSARPTRTGSSGALPTFTRTSPLTPD